jgi:hypothetical protein
MLSRHEHVLTTAAATDIIQNVPESANAEKLIVLEARRWMYLSFGYEPRTGERGVSALSVTIPLWGRAQASSPGKT